jgi:hypothetical protein
MFDILKTVAHDASTPDNPARENEMPTSREICTQILNDYMHAKQFGTLELMQLAYETGRLNAFGEAKEVAARTTTHPSTVMDIADELNDLTGAYDREFRPRSVASDVSDPVAADRRALAREYNRPSVRRAR